MLLYIGHCCWRRRWIWPVPPPGTNGAERTMLTPLDLNEEALRGNYTHACNTKRCSLRHVYNESRLVLPAVLQKVGLQFSICSQKLIFHHPDSIWTDGPTYRSRSTGSMVYFCSQLLQLCQWGLHILFPFPTHVFNGAIGSPHKRRPWVLETTLRHFRGKFLDTQ